VQSSVDSLLALQSRQQRLTQHPSLRYLPLHLQTDLISRVGRILPDSRKQVRRSAGEYDCSLPSLIRYTSTAHIGASRAKDVFPPSTVNTFVKKKKV